MCYVVGIEWVYLRSIGTLVAQRWLPAPCDLICDVQVQWSVSLIVFLYLSSALSKMVILRYDEVVCGHDESARRLGVSGLHRKSERANAGLRDVPQIQLNKERSTS